MEPLEQLLDIGQRAVSKIKDTRTATEVQIGVAKKYREAGLRTKAVRALAETKRLIPPAELHFLRAHFFEAVAKEYLAVGLGSEALAALKSAHFAAAQIWEQPLRAIHLGEAAFLYHQTNHVPEAREILLRMIALGEKEDASLFAYPFLERGIFGLIRIGLESEALSILARNQACTFSGLLHIGVCNAYIEVGLQAKAREMAQHLAQKRHDSSFSLLLLAEVLVKSGDKGTALALTTRIKERAEHEQDIKSKLEMYCKLASLYFSLGNEFVAQELLLNISEELSRQPISPASDKLSEKLSEYFAKIGLFRVALSVAERIADKECKLRTLKIILTKRAGVEAVGDCLELIHSAQSDAEQAIFVGLLTVAYEEQDGSVTVKLVEDLQRILSAEHGD